ncbi:MAG: hypothetical protein ABIV06_00870 [Thermoanaerobaculia bacterium]
MSRLVSIAAILRVLSRSLPIPEGEAHGKPYPKPLLAFLDSKQR